MCLYVRVCVLVCVLVCVFVCVHPCAYVRLYVFVCTCMAAYMCALPSMWLKPKYLISGAWNTRTVGVACGVIADAKSPLVYAFVGLISFAYSDDYNAIMSC